MQSDSDELLSLETITTDSRCPVCRQWVTAMIDMQWIRDVEGELIYEVRDSEPELHRC